MRRLIWIFAGHTCPTDTCSCVTTNIEQAHSMLICVYFFFTPPQFSIGGGIGAYSITAVRTADPYVRTNVRKWCPFDIFWKDPWIRFILYIKVYNLTIGQVRFRVKFANIMGGTAFFQLHFFFFFFFFFFLAKCYEKWVPLKISVLDKYSIHVYIIK